MLIKNVNNLIANEKQKVTKKDNDFNQEEFFKMLVLQMRYQDPMSPDDTNDFTQQITMFNIMEQNMKANRHLEEILVIQKANYEQPTMENMISYIGNKVEADTSTVTLIDGRSDIIFTPPKDINKIELSISNLGREEIYRTTIKNLQPITKFIWHGKNNTGEDLESGQYKISLSTADGKTKKYIEPKLIGTVDSISNVSGYPYLEISDTLIDPKQILSIKNT
ncbi:MAG: hypothetical protein HRK26_03635 [Rickettsiaceae bacterium H1]|nr:hypothetical protein [Rickettsiaceae bacterium H1]